jgi:hypothetical protein
MDPQASVRSQSPPESLFGIKLGKPDRPDCSSKYIYLSRLQNPIPRGLGLAVRYN